MLFNNRYGVGFNNVEGIMLRITSGPIYAFNAYNELLRLDRPRFHLACLSLLNKVADWYLESVEKK